MGVGYPGVLVAEAVKLTETAALEYQEVREDEMEVVGVLWNQEGEIWDENDENELLELVREKENTEEDVPLFSSESVAEEVWVTKSAVKESV